MKRAIFSTVIFSMLVIFGCKKDKDTESAKEYTGISLEEYISKYHNGLQPVDEKSGVYVIVSEEGQGELPSAGDRLYCYYKGLYLDGTTFDTLHQRPAEEELPDYNGKHLYVFTYNTTDSLFQHVPGWYKGFSKLKRGSKATFILPAEQAYGKKGKGSILPNSPLMFEVELINKR